MGNIQFRQEREADAQVLGGFLLGQTTNGRQGQARFGHD